MAANLNRRNSERENVSKTKMMLDGSISLDNLDQYLKDAKPAPKLSSLLVQLLAERDMSNEDLGIAANIGRSTIYKIIGGKLLPEQDTLLRIGGKLLPEQDTLLRIAFVLELTGEETQQLLKTGRRAQLTASRPRDVAIIYGLQNALTLDEMDEILMERGMEPITPPEKKTSELIKPLMGSMSFADLLARSSLNCNASFMKMLGKAKAGTSIEALDEIADGLERDDLLAIGFVLGVNKVEMQRLLRIAHRSFLNSKDARDNLILNALASGEDLRQMNAILLENNMDPLMQA